MSSAWNHLRKRMSGAKEQSTEWLLPLPGEKPKLTDGRSFCSILHFTFKPFSARRQSRWELALLGCAQRV